MADPRFIKPGFDQALSHLVEECGEVLSAAGKLQRHGALSVNPLLPPSEQETNIAWLWREMEDLECALSRLAGEVRAEYSFGFLPFNPGPASADVPTIHQMSSPPKAPRP